LLRVIGVIELPKEEAIFIGLKHHLFNSKEFDDSFRSNIRKEPQKQALLKDGRNKLRCPSWLVFSDTFIYKNFKIYYYQYIGLGYRKRGR